MAEHPEPEFTSEELLQQAAGNWNALFFAAVDYLREQGLSPEDFVRWLGERFAPGWDEMRGDLEQIAYFAALNPVALGAELRGYDVREREVAIVTSTEHLDAPRADIDLLGELYRPIMDNLDVDYEWELGEGVTTLRLRSRH
jgi:hypothetical protein